MSTWSPLSSSACSVIVISSDTPLPMNTSSTSNRGKPSTNSYRVTTARRAGMMPLESEYPCAYGSAAMMSRMITSGASKPNGAGLPMLSFRMR